MTEYGLEIPIAAILAYVAIGTAAGFFAGLLGIGGGALIGPLLLIVFTDLLNFPPQHAAHLAIGTSMAAIALTAPVSAATHIRRGNAHLKLTLAIGAAAAAGAYAGARIALALPAAPLKLLLALFLAATTLHMLLPPRRPPAALPTPPPPIPKKELLPISAAIGALSAAIGIGGGTLTVSYLHHRGLPIRIAIGTSATVGVPLGLAAALIYATTPLPAAPLGAMGAVYLPALAGIAPLSLAAAHIGATYTNKLPAPLLRKLFAAVTAAAATRLLLGQFP